MCLFLYYSYVRIILVIFTPLSFSEIFLKAQIMGIIKNVHLYTSIRKTNNNDVFIWQKFVEINDFQVKLES